MARINGSSPARRGDAAGARDSRSTSRKPACPSRTPKRLQTFSVTSGRRALGVVKLSDGLFTSVSTGGTVIGTFASLRARALPDGGAP
jgi:hypothetical protein